MSDPGPQCLFWLPVLHRMAAAENAVHHGITCGSCGDKEFRGLRYKSDRSAHYHLCQWCFWRGRIPAEHRDDVFKEYNSFKTPGTSGSSGSSKFQCVGGKTKSNLPKYPEIEVPLDLTNMIPPSPLPSVRSNGPIQLAEFGRNTSPYQSLPLPPRSHSRNRNPQISSSGGLLEHQHFDNPYQSVNPLMAERHQGFGGVGSDAIEDEHSLIAQYAQEMHLGIHNDGIGRNIVVQNAPMMMNNGGSGSLIVGNNPEGKKALQQSRQLVYDLERKNQEIMHDIERLRRSHLDQKQQTHFHQKERPRNPQIMSELVGLRSHKHELESRLDELQGARKDLMDELDELMKLLKVQEMRQFGNPEAGQFGRPPAGPHYNMLLDAERNNSFTNIAGMGIEQAFPATVLQECDPQGIILHDQQPAYEMHYPQHQQNPIYQLPEDAIRPQVFVSNTPTPQDKSNPHTDHQSQRSSSQQRNRHRSSSSNRKKSAASRKRSPSANSKSQKSQQQQHMPRQQDNNKWSNNEETNDNVDLLQPHNTPNTLVVNHS